MWTAFCGHPLAAGGVRTAVCEAIKSFGMAGIAATAANAAFGPAGLSEGKFLAREFAIEQTEWLDC